KLTGPQKLHKKQIRQAQGGNVYRSRLVMYYRSSFVIYYRSLLAHVSIAEKPVILSEKEDAR
ncbi:MAG: hypothetical protein ACLS8L_07795, partial [Anaerovoracaceae bacterium]